MRYERCGKYLDIYVDNPDQCNLVVLMSEEKEDKICARALLWTDVEGRRIMDRIYSNRTQDEQLFKDFAKKNKFYHKKNQNMLEDEYFVSPEGEEEELMTKIELSAGRFEYFPYLDTFKYFYEGKPSHVTNNSRLPYDYTLTDTDGSAEGLECDFCNGNSIVECPECYGRGDFSCENCNGEGEVECDTCGGAHEMECPECNGEGTSEDGSECTYCEGRGMQTCHECDGDSITCNECDGDGRIECDWCRGEGEVDCPECH
jgi:DnaJ-class molecular chaperone